MAIDYNRLAQITQRLINENGRDTTLTKLDRGDANPSEPWRTPGANDVTVGPIKTLLLPYREGDVDGTLVRRGDMQGLVAALDDGGEDLEEFDKLNDDGEIWKILNPTVINPGSVRLLYKFNLRK